MKFSVVIPTLWKSKRIHGLLKNLINCDRIDEIILIDNNKKFFDYYETLPDKICLISPNKNLFVNPSWNLGVKKSRNQAVAILNDDIDFNTSVFEFVSPEILDNYGIIGMHKSNYSLKEDLEYQLDYWTGEDEHYGWGCMIFLNKKLWTDIPENIKVWYGDNHILYLNESLKSVLRGLRIETEMSSTSDLLEFNQIKHDDQINYIDHQNLKIKERS